MNEDVRIVFGPESRGYSIVARARTSGTLFVRSQHQLSLYQKGAIGRTLNATEELALLDGKWEKLRQLAYRPAVPLLRRRGEPYVTIEQRIKQLGLNLEQVAHLLGLEELAKELGLGGSFVSTFRSRKQIPFRVIERLAQTLALDERRLGSEGAGGDATLGECLGDLGQSHNLTPTAVLTLSEAAWVIRRQCELARSLEVDSEWRRRSVIDDI